MKTAYHQQKEKADQAIYDECQRLMNQPGAMKTAVELHLMKKYKLHARSTIWKICHRVAKRQTGQAA